jgi:ABC-type antimicrobial peptide transport system permease subunit
MTKGYEQNMIKNTENSKYFYLELLVVLLIPFIILCASIPTNVLNSNIFMKLIQSIGELAIITMLFAGIPVGIIGIIKSKRMNQFRIPTKVLSIVNLSMGAIEIVILIVIFCAVLFGGISA